MAQGIRRESGGRRTLVCSNGHHLLRKPRNITSGLSPRAATNATLAERASCRNRLLDTLPQAEMARLRPHLERVALPQGAVLYRPEQQIRHVYFPTGALIALVTEMEDGASIETGLVGAEGVAGLPVLWGADSALQTMLVRHAGAALRMRADLLCPEANCVDVLRESLMRYANFFCACAAQAAACNRLHTVERQVATWLLTIRDRLECDEFYLTHELIARSLGVRRAGVSIVINKFTRASWLRNDRARIIIVDNRRLESAACKCYRVVKTELDRYLDLCANCSAPRALYAGRAAV